MGTFDPHFDTPGQIIREGEEVELKFERLTSTTGRVSWKIPSPAHGCNVDNQAYNGMVVVLNTVANKVSNRPNDGIRYTSDPVADEDLHAGDKINGALVVGAFYNDKTTTEFVITDLEPDAAYFITGHAVDAQHRYHQAGASAYSLPIEVIEGTDDTTAFHEIELSNQGQDILPTDSTNLAVGDIYTMTVTIDGTKHELQINGTDAQTFDDLVAAINKQLLLVDNPPQSSVPPNTGMYYYNSSTGELFQWDGFQHNEVEVINHPIDPSTVPDGTYWLDTDAGINELFLRSLGAWVLQTPQIETGYDVIDPPCDSYWFNDVTGETYKWNGTTWCLAPQTLLQTFDPSDPENLACGSFWLNTDGELFEWQTVGDCNKWVQVEAITSEINPLTLPNGYFWYDDTNDKLFVRNDPPGEWVEDENVFIQDEEPLTNVVGSTWFVPSTQQLFELDGSETWVEQPVIVFGSDPTDVESCDLWFNTTTETLFVWDIVNNEWDQVAQFFDQDNDPSEMKELEVGSIWVDNTDPTNRVFYRWDGAQFILIDANTMVSWSSDPTQIPAGTIWYQTTSEMYFEWDGSIWNILDPIESDNDPTLSIIGTFWFNTTNNTLNQWNGVAWIPVGFSSAPLTPTNGTMWFDTTTMQLFVWDNGTWVEAQPIAIAELNVDNGPDICSPNSNIVITTTTKGSAGGVQIGKRQLTSGQVNSNQSLVFDGTLFNALGVTAILIAPVAGADGLENIPMYEQIGVGTDGTPDERRELAQSLLVQLGHPTVQIELTKNQMDEAIQSALEELRLRSSAAYRRVYFMLDLQTGKQRYVLTSKVTGFNEIVNIMGIWRMHSAFHGVNHGDGIFGHAVVQHLYYMGSYDLVSYHLISDYIEQLEQIFATRVTYTWDETSRELDIFQSSHGRGHGHFHGGHHSGVRERVLVDAVIERTEQELLTSRWTKNWIERWALAQAQLTLAEIRGKYASLPGAGGGVSLNAADLHTQASENIAWCLEDIDNFVVNDIENLGIGSEVIIG